MKVRFVAREKPKSRLQKTFSLEGLVHGPAPDGGVLFCVFGLLVFGWVMVYSSSALFAELRYHDQFFFFKRQLLWSLIGLGAFIAAANVPIEIWQRSARPLYLLTTIALVLVLFVGPEVAGAKRWIRVAGLNFQPSELAKVAMILLVADYIDRRQSRLKDFKRGLLPLLILVGVLFFLILVEPDLGTPVLMTVVLSSLLVLGGVRWKHFFLLGLAALPALATLVVNVNYRMHRIFSYLDPWSDPQGAGYQLVQSLLAMGSGGIFGRGLGSSRVKIANLPEAHTDFVFSILGEELGLLGTLTCAALFLFLCLRGLRIARSAPTSFSRLLAAGLSLMIGFQAFINMGVASGLFPTKGMPLPFLSFGGSSLVIMLFSIGLLASISRKIKAGPMKVPR